MYLRTRRLSRARLLLLLGLIVVCGVISVFIFLQTRSTDGVVSESDTVARVVTYSTDTPDETKPAGDYEWKGGANDPKKITIPELEIEGFIQNVGVDQRAEIAVPNNIHLAGWFVNSVRPGDKGLSIIDGHLNGPRLDGVFASLEKVKIGDRFWVEFGDSSRRAFAVRDVQTVDLDAAADVLYSQNPSIHNQLNLITCGGTYDRNARLYDKRVIVVSEFIKDD